MVIFILFLIVFNLIFSAIRTEKEEYGFAVFHFGLVLFSCTLYLALVTIKI